MTEALLVLSDGTQFRGRGVGATGEVFGEVVFNTALTGYQEILTDPSYEGQLVAMTYPHQGNYGVSSLDDEAPRPFVRGFIMRSLTKQPSSWRSDASLNDYLVRHGVIGIEDIDTRRLTRALRSAGVMVGGISTTDTDAASLLERVRRAPGLEGVDHVRAVTPPAAYEADADELLSTGGLQRSPPARVARGARVAAVDYGMKRNILRLLVAHGFVVRVYPAFAQADEILSWQPDGVFLSNGPGDPAALGYAAQTIRGVLAAGVPVFGICLGHQLLGSALGADTYKLKFGHRGANHPVKDITTRRIEITTQNHGFAVDAGMDPAAGGDAWRAIAAADPRDWVWPSQKGDVQLTHFDLNDGTLEGMRCLELPAFSVQYHPEAAPGPHDARHLFADFAALIEANH
jgi:carbamoyl-phosphate synthase small subunit